MAKRKPVPAPPPRRPLKERLCRLVVRLFLWLYLIALIISAAGMVDPFGILPRPLAGVLLVILGLPWSIASAATWFPDDWQPVAAALAPIVNWLILGFLCAWQRLKPTLPRDEQ